MKKILSNSPKDTRQLAAKLAKTFKNGVIALTGQLGAGKTVFVKGFAQGLGIQDKIISPTFVLIRQYPIPQSNRIFYHIDLYRLENTKQVNELGLKQLWSNPQNIIVLEWADKLKDLPAHSVRISIQKRGILQREFFIHTP